MNETDATTTITTHMKTARTAKHSKIELKDRKIWQKYYLSLDSKEKKKSVNSFRKDKKENITEKCLNLNNS